MVAEGAPPGGMAHASPIAETVAPSPAARELVSPDVLQLYSSERGGAESAAERASVAEAAALCDAREALRATQAAVERKAREAAAIRHKVGRLEATLEDAMALH
eukprot:6141949-Prymnesium_polylepis.1